MSETTWQPMSEQPHPDTHRITWNSIVQAYLCWTKGLHHGDRVGHPLQPPHRVGERVVIYCDHCKGNGRIEMLEHCPKCKGKPITYRTYTSSVPKRACDVTEEQAEAMGYVADDDFPALDRFDWWCDEQFGIEGRHETWGWLETFVDEK